MTNAAVIGRKPPVESGDTSRGLESFGSREIGSGRDGERGGGLGSGAQLGLPPLHPMQSAAEPT